MCTASAGKPVRPVIYRLFCIKKRRKSVKLQVYLKLADGYYEMTFSIPISRIELATPQGGAKALACCDVLRVLCPFNHDRFSRHEVERALAGQRPVACRKPA